jgi:hypothetical protein
LATVYAIVQQHQAWVDVQSEFGRGTTFRILLPQADPAVAVQPVRPLPPKRSPAPELGTILVGRMRIRFA